MWSWVPALREPAVLDIVNGMVKALLISLLNLPFITVVVVVIHWNNGLNRWMYFTAPFLRAFIFLFFLMSLDKDLEGEGKWESRANMISSRWHVYVTSLTELHLNTMKSSTYGLNLQFTFSVIHICVYMDIYVLLCLWKQCYLYCCICCYFTYLLFAFELLMLPFFKCLKSISDFVT